MKPTQIEITDRSKELLSQAKVNSVLHLPQMTDSEYDSIKYLVEYIGGHWREKYKGFVFDSDAEYIQSKLHILRNLPSIKIDPISKFRIDNQFYPTPDWLAREMVGIANISETDRVLEPSAGKAAILNYIASLTERYTAVELNFANCKWLRSRGYRVNQQSFEKYYESHINTSTKFNKVVMNPPFSDKRDLLHTVMAYNLLAPGGILVGLVAENSLYYDRPITHHFNALLKSIGATIQEVPHGSFKESGTMVDVVMLVMPRTDAAIYKV